MSLGPKQIVGPFGITINAPPSVDDGEVPLVRLGDASIASPFTAKTSSVMSSTAFAWMPESNDFFSSRAHYPSGPVYARHYAADVQDSGAQLPHFCVQLEVRSLRTSSSRNLTPTLSVLYLDGIKMGDTQATIVGMMIALCFLFLSHSKPLHQLSAKRPLPNIFSLCMMFLSRRYTQRLQLRYAAVNYRTVRDPLDELNGCRRLGQERFNRVRFTTVGPELTFGFLAGKNQTRRLSLTYSTRACS